MSVPCVQSFVFSVLPHDLGVILIALGPNHATASGQALNLTSPMLSITTRLLTTRWDTPSPKSSVLSHHVRMTPTGQIHSPESWISHCITTVVLCSSHTRLLKKYEGPQRVFTLWIINLPLYKLN